MNSPRPHPGPPEQLGFLAAGGEMGERLRTFDWSRSPLGPPAAWPQSLKTAVRIMLTSRQPIWIGWGGQLINLYNDSYLPIIGGKHPWALGEPASIVWREIWDEIGPLLSTAMQGVEGTYVESQMLIMERNGYPEETYYTYSYTPIPDDQGAPGGIICANTDDTQRVIGERQLETLRELATRTTEARSAGEACDLAATALEASPRDLPFALIYLTDQSGERLTLCGSSGIRAGTDVSPKAVSARDNSPWPFQEALATQEAQELTSLSTRFPSGLPTGGWNLAPHSAIALPIPGTGQRGISGVLVAGLNPFRLVDHGYRGFLELVAGQVGTAIASASAYETEKRRAELLAEVDRVKTAFFSNVSHEFRTPLTLMLGPLNDILAKGHLHLSRTAADQLELVGRNGRRLLRLVNSLLDFSRIEAGRAQAHFEPTDLAGLTADLASLFRSACQRADLELLVDCPALDQPVYVDREMWEKVVLNLLSNALKFTFSGRIQVVLRQDHEHAILQVVDTGTGIPADAMPKLFERFHRVENARARTHEGTGIGLAFVQELVRLHGGTVVAESALGKGSTFTVSIPLGLAHLPAEHLGISTTAMTPAQAAEPFVEEAMSWFGEGDAATVAGDVLPEPPAAPYAHASRSDRPRIIVADDNADMRQYVARLLGDHYRVETVGDGEAALAAARARPPELVISDVMMPRMDGLGLLGALREDPELARVPIILLSARAGEEARVEGLKAGADDYLTKPFSGRELLARVDAHVRMARMRREAESSIRQSEERFRGIFDQSLVGIAETDLAGRFLQVNPRYCEMVGRTAAELADMRRQDITHPDDVSRTVPLFERAAREGTPFVIEKRYIRPDNTSFWVSTSVSVMRDPDGKPDRIVAATLDITDRMLVEEALRNSEAHFRNMADNAPVMLWVTDPTGYGTYLSHQWYEYTGRRPHGDEGYGWLEAVHPDDMMEAQETFLGAVARQEPFSIEYRLRRYDGEYRWALDTGVPRFEGEVFKGYVCCVFDVHERRLASDALREADRLKDEFLATLAHELRNPLAPLRNSMEVLRLAAHDPQRVGHAHDVMDRQLRHIVRLVDDLFEVSRISRGKIMLKKERVLLASVVQQVVEASRPLIERGGHELIVRVPAEPIYLEADATRLSQVFSNLLNNAAKFTDRGGRIEFTVERQEGEIMVSVRDTGIGIPTEMLDRVFEMFTQVDTSLERSRGGLGIGLSLVKRLTEKHGGRVEARSQGLGTGSEFVIWLPVLMALVGEEQASAEHPSPPTPRRRILVVDDNRDSAESMAMILEILGNELRTAHDGVDALSVAAAFRPDVVLLDIGMPRLNGYEVARRIRAESWGRSLLLVAITGWGLEEDRRRSQEAGFDAHIVKPVDPKVLAELLAQRRSETA